jgi:hypothetical protein
VARNRRTSLEMFVLGFALGAATTIIGIALWFVGAFAP